MRTTVLLASICLVLLLPGVAISKPPTTTLTFDELSTQPVDGVHIAGVSFSFHIGGAPSSDAFYGAFGPGFTTYVQDPSIEGNTAGALTLTFDHPTTVLEFGLALSTSETLTPGATVELFNPGGHSRGTQSLTTQSTGFFFTEGGFVYRGGAIGSAVITFSPAAARFALDNLTFRALPPAGHGVGAAQRSTKAWAR